MRQRFVRAFPLVAALLLTPLHASAVAVATTLPESAAAAPTTPSSTDSAALDFKSIVSVSYEGQCGDKTMALADRTKYACVDGQLQKVSEDDLIAYKVKVWNHRDGKKQFQAQLGLVAPVGLPAVSQSSNTTGYLVAIASEKTGTSTLKAGDVQDVITFAFNTVGREKDGKFVVQSRFITESSEGAAAHTLDDGQTVAGVNGEVSKSTHTASFASGESRTYHVGASDVEVTVVALPKQ